jgi:hypothetical protein
MAAPGLRAPVDSDVVGRLATLAEIEGVIREGNIAKLVMLAALDVKPPSWQPRIRDRCGLLQRLAALGLLRAAIRDQWLGHVHAIAANVRVAAVRGCGDTTRTQVK